MEVHFADEHRCQFPHDILRGFCPCAGCQGHSGPIEFQPGGNDELRELSPIGNYAVALTWGDGHASGIYSYRFLRTLGGLLEQLGTDELKRRAQIPR